MVLESLIPAPSAERKPIVMLPLAFVYATFGVFIGMWIFPNYAGLTMVFFAVMALIPIMLRLISFEESKIFSRTSKDRGHKETLPFFVFMFLGTVIAFTFWFTVFPETTVNNLFSIQINTIEQINSNISGDFSGGHLLAIILNNFRVLFFVLLFSFIYGAGAIFILTWNASVISVAIGNTAREILSSTAGTVGATTVAGHFHAVSLSSLRYLIHGIPEIGSYFVAGLAGGMISIAVIRHELFDKKFNKVLLDSLNLIMFSIGLILLSAIIEVFISPLVPV